MGDADSPEERLKALGITLPDPPPPAAAYRPWTRSGSLLFTAGQLPVTSEGLTRTGKVGVDLDTEAAAELARLAAVNVLAVARSAVGDLSQVRVIKVTVFVASSPDFTDHHLVANGASQLLVDVLGGVGAHARSAVGVAALPLGSPVEVEAVLEIG